MNVVKRSETRYWLSALVLLAGCGTSLPTSTIKPQVAQRDLALIPAVQFVGDDIAAGLVGNANNPMWRCDDCIAKADSAIALANFPAVLATNPNIVVLLIGSYDIHGNTFAGLFREDCNAIYGQICANVQSMITQAQAAGAKVVIGTIPPLGQGSAALYYENCCDVGYEIELNQQNWNSQIPKLYPPGGSVTVVDFASVLQQSGPTGDPAWDYTINRFIPSYTDNGIDPNAAGYAQMEAVITPVLTALRTGSGPK